MSAFLTPDDTHDLGGEHARSVLEGMECVHFEPFSLGKAPLSFVPFLERIGAIICPPRGSGPAATEAVKRLSSRPSQVELANELREEFFISRSTASNESKLREEDVLYVTSSDPAGSALLAHGGLMKAERIFLSLLSLSAPRCRAAGGYEACASARQTYSGGTEKGEWLAVDLMSDLSLSGITSQLP